jgi:hypothetical protein
MKHIKAYITLIALLILEVNTGFSQDGQYIEIRDFETWNSAQVNFELNKIWSVGIQGQVRFDKNSTELKSFFPELTTEIKLFKNFELGVASRFTNKNDNEGNIQGSEYFFRYQLDATYRHDINRFDLKYRLRYSNSNEMGISRIDGDIPEKYFRLKTSIDYNIKKWKFDPEFSGEIFNKHIKNGQSNGFDFIRLSIGTSYKAKAYGKIGVYYRIKKEISAFYPKTTYSTVLKYTYTFKK